MGLPDPGIEPTSLLSFALAGRFITTSDCWEAMQDLLWWHMNPLAVAHGLRNVWAQQLAVHGLSCSSAYGILVPQSGIKPVSSALQGGFLTTGPPGKSVFSFSTLSVVLAMSLS